jgi:hypothetical protein
LKNYKLYLFMMTQYIGESVGLLLENIEHNSHFSSAVSYWFCDPTWRDHWYFTMRNTFSSDDIILFSMRVISKDIKESLRLWQRGFKSKRPTFYRSMLLTLLQRFEENKDHKICRRVIKFGRKSLGQRSFALENPE